MKIVGLYEWRSVDVVLNLPHLTVTPRLDLLSLAATCMMYSLLCYFYPGVWFYCYFFERDLSGNLK